MESIVIDKNRTAVLIMDYQNDIVQRVPENKREELVERARTVLSNARSSKLPVIYVVVRFREGYPEVSPRNKRFATMKNSGQMQEGTSGAEIHPKLSPHPGDIVVTKRRVGAFSTTDLESILRSKNIDTLVLLGIATSGVVLSTVRWAADMDYAMVVLGDVCADFDEEVHRVLTQKVFPRQATVLTTQEFLTTIKGH